MNGSNGEFIDQVRLSSCDLMPYFILTSSVPWYLILDRFFNLDHRFHTNTKH